MSIGPMGIMGSLAGGQLQQSKGSETDRAQQETAAQARETKTSEKAELAAGIGQTEEDAEASDRDADGRRLWEPGEQHEEQETADGTSGADQDPPRAKDPDGKRGANLDLSG